MASHSIVRTVWRVLAGFPGRPPPFGFGRLHGSGGNEWRVNRRTTVWQPVQPPERNTGIRTLNSGPQLQAGSRSHGAGAVETGADRGDGAWGRSKGMDAHARVSSSLPLRRGPWPLRRRMYTCLFADVNGSHLAPATLLVRLLLLISTQKRPAPRLLRVEENGDRVFDGGWKSHGGIISQLSLFVNYFSPRSPAVARVGSAGMPPRPAPAGCAPPPRTPRRRWCRWGPGPAGCCPARGSRAARPSPRSGPG